MRLDILPPKRCKIKVNLRLSLDDVVSRQNLRKTRLLVELDNERKRLTLMQEEINTLQAPIPPGGSGQLAEDIRQLQNSCKQMVQLVENAGPYGE